MEKAVKLFKFVPEINVLKSLTSMTRFINVIKYFLDIKVKDMQYEGLGLVNRYLIIDKPVMTVTEICKNKFNAKLVIRIPKLQTLLMVISSLISLVGLQKRIPLSKERIIKLYKPTDYNHVDGYKEWFDEKA